MRKILIMTLCFGALFANEEIKKLQEENKMLKERLDRIENMLKTPYDDYFDMLEKRHLQTMKELNEIINKEIDFVKEKGDLQRNFASVFKSGEVVSKVKQEYDKKDEKTSNKTEFKTYNSKSNKEYKISEILKDLNAFKNELKAKFPDLKDVKLDNFYINKDGFNFSSDDLFQNIKIKFEEMKNYLKEDFLKDLAI